MLPPLQGLSINPVAVPTDASKRSRDDDELDIRLRVNNNVQLSRCSNRARLDAVHTLFRNVDPEVMEAHRPREFCENDAKYNTLKPVEVFDIVHSGGAMYNYYIAARNNMSVRDDCTKYGPFLECVRTDQVEGLEDRTNIGPLRSWINEKYLVHGLNVEIIEDVLTSHCDPSYTTATMYAPKYTAFYQAEDVGKADQYALTRRYLTPYNGADQAMNTKLGFDTQNEVLKRTYYVLITRTLLGCANHTFRKSAPNPSHPHGESHAPPHIATLDTEGWKRFDLNGELIYPGPSSGQSLVAPYDSLIVEHGGVVRGDYNSGNNNVLDDQGGFREFLVTKCQQVLPVMLVAYVRVEQTPRPAFDHLRLGCFYPVKPAIPSLIEQLKDIDEEERYEAKDGLRKLVPALFAQLRAENYVALPDASVSSTGKEVRVANPGLVKLLPSLVPVLRSIKIGPDDNTWWDEAISLLEEKYITPCQGTSMARAVMIKLLAQERVIDALMHSIDARQPKSYHDQLRVLDRMLFPRVMPASRPGDDVLERNARQDLVSGTYSNISYAMLEMGYTAKLVNLLKSGFGTDPYRPRLASILNNLIEAANRRGDVVDAVRDGGTTLPALVPTLPSLPTPPKEAYHETPNNWLDSRKNVCELLGTLINGRANQDAFVNAGGLEALVRELLKLVEIPQRASQKQFDDVPGAKNFELAPAYPAIKAIFRTITLAISAREEHADRLLTITELEGVMSKLVGWKKPDELTFPPLSFWNACVTRLNGPNGQSDIPATRNALLSLRVVPIPSARGSTRQQLLKNAMEAFVKVLGNSPANIVRMAKDAMTSDMHEKLCKQFAKATCSNRLELDKIAGAVLGYIENDTQAMQRWTDTSAKPSKTAEQLIKDKRCDSGNFIRSVTALHKEWLRLMAKLDDGEEAVERRAKLLKESQESDFSQKQMRAIRELPGKLSGSTLYSEAVEEFEAKRYQAEFVKQDGLKNLIRLLGAWFERDQNLVVKPNKEDLKAVLDALTATVTNQPDLGDDLLSTKSTREILREYTSGKVSTDSGLNNATAEEKREVADRGVALLYATRKSLLSYASVATEKTTEELELLLILLHGQRAQAGSSTEHRLTVRAVQDALIEEYAIPRLLAKLNADDTEADDAMQIVQVFDELAKDNEWARRWMLESNVGSDAINMRASQSNQAASWNAAENRHNKWLRRKHLPSLLAQLASPSEARDFVPDAEASVRTMDTNARGAKLLINFVSLGSTQYPPTEAIHAIWVLTRTGHLRNAFLNVQVEQNKPETRTLPILVAYLAGRGTSPNDDTKVLMADVLEVLVSLIEKNGVKDDAVVTEIKASARYDLMRNILANPNYNAQSTSSEPRFMPALNALTPLLA